MEIAPSNLLGERASACSPAFTEAFSIADVNAQNIRLPLYHDVPQR